MTEIICTDCGRLVDAPNSATRYCSLHRLSRNLSHFGDRTAKCLACGTRFCPIVAHDRLCWKCALDKLPGLGRHHVTGDCRLCDATAVPVYSDEVPVCIPCLRRPTKRRELIKRVLKKARAATIE